MARRINCAVERRNAMNIVRRHTDRDNKTDEQVLMQIL